MIKKAVLIILLIDLGLSGSIIARMSPAETVKRNLEAKCILIGEVTGTGKVLLPEPNPAEALQKGVFCLKVRHIVKGYEAVKPGDEIHIIFRLPQPPKDGLAAHQSGFQPVSVHSGDVVIVYINPSRHKKFYSPLAQGESVKIITPSKPAAP